MGLYESETYVSDIDLVIKSNSFIFDEIFDKTIFITGGTGLVCSPIVDMILRANYILGTKIKLIIAGRSEEKIRQRFEKQKYDYVYYDATKRNTLDLSTDYIIHGASNSSPTDISTRGIETMIDNIGGIYELLTYAAENDVINTLYISSSEIYGQRKTNNQWMENEYGSIDILLPRNAYSSSKRAAETLCVCFSEEKKIKTTIVRPGHIYGPTAKRTDTHVSSLFSFAAADGNNLIMKSSGEQVRSWCYCIDSAMAILYVLVRGKNKNAYNISSPNSILSIKEMAQYLSKKAEVQLVVEIPNEKEERRFNPMFNSSLKSDKLMDLGWKPLFDCEVGFEHTIKVIRESKL